MSEETYQRTTQSVTTPHGTIEMDVSVPPPSLMEKWKEFVAGLVPELQQAIAQHDIHPGRRFALKADATRAIFYRVIGMRMYGSHTSPLGPPHLHAELLAHTHDGIPFACISDIHADELCAYAYSPDVPPTKESLEEELVVMDRIKELEAMSGGEVVRIQLDGDKSGDALMDALAAADPLAGDTFDEEVFH